MRADILEELARFPALEVIDLADGQDPPAEAQLLLEGSMETRGQERWLVTRLLDLDEGVVLWSDAFPMPEPKDVPAAGSRIARQLSEALKIHPSGGR